MTLLESSRDLLMKFLPYRIIEANSMLFDDVLFGYMFKCCYSPNGEYLAITTGMGEVYIYDMKIGVLRHILCDHLEDTMWVAFSPDGKMLATCSYDQTVIIYDVQQDFCVLKKLETNSDVHFVGFSPCSKFLFTGDCLDSLKKWDLQTYCVVNELFSTPFTQFKQSSDGRYILLGGGNNLAKLITTDSFSVVRTFSHDGKTRALDFHPTKRIIAVGDTSNKVKLWNMDSGLLIHTFDVNCSVLDLLFFSERVLLYLLVDGSIVSFDIDTCEQIQTVHSGCNEYSAFAMSSDKAQLLCGPWKEEKIKVYQIDQSFDSSFEGKLLDLAKSEGNILKTMISMNYDIQIVRQLVTAGINMNLEDFEAVYDTCWDLIDFNEVNGGNMHDFIKQNEKIKEYYSSSDNDI
eukprot:TRINITY_DN1555_c0_g1_i1.p1 TRINITY_DN1555_c0_g1~~TRINITY_DN1555_c0_g1_i1.p1  ORF type:complete len:413 (-),score=82.17 TRINITY_DN1555_c0_g1_i1:242-1450(-)